MAIVTLQASGVEDTYIVSDDATSNRDGSVLLIGENNAAVGQVCRTLLQFDLSSIPAGSVINSATLSIYFDQNGNYRSSNDRTASVYRVLRDWVEAQATWNVYSTGNNWGTAGCSNTTSDREATNIGTAAFSTGNSAGEAASFTLTASKIQEYVDGDLTNNGFLIQVATETDDQFYFESSETGSDSTKPKLVIDYTPPVTGGNAFFM